MQLIEILHGPASPGLCHKQKTPSKMDVAQWDKHWIKIELDGIDWYWVVFYCIQRYSMAFDGFVGICWYLMVFDGIQCYSMVFVGIHRDS